MIPKERRKQKQFTTKEWLFKNIFPLVLALMTIAMAWGSIKTHIKDLNMHLTKQERQKFAKQEGINETRHINIMGKFGEIAEMIKDLRK